MWVHAGMMSKWLEGCGHERVNGVWTRELVDGWMCDCGGWCFRRNTVETYPQRSSSFIGYTIFGMFINEKIPITSKVGNMDAMVFVSKYYY